MPAFDSQTPGGIPQDEKSQLNRYRPSGIEPRLSQET